MIGTLLNQLVDHLRLISDKGYSPNKNCDDGLSCGYPDLNLICLSWSSAKWTWIIDNN